MYIGFQNTTKTEKNGEKQRKNDFLNCFDAWQNETFSKYDVTGNILGNIQTYGSYDYELDPT